MLLHIFYIIVIDFVMTFLKKLNILLIVINKFSQ